MDDVIIRIGWKLGAGQAVRYAEASALRAFRRADLLPGHNTWALLARWEKWRGVLPSLQRLLRLMTWYVDRLPQYLVLLTRRWLSERNVSGTGE